MQGRQQFKHEYIYPTMIRKEREENLYPSYDGDDGCRCYCHFNGFFDFQMSSRAEQQSSFSGLTLSNGWTREGSFVMAARFIVIIVPLLSVR